MNPTGDAARQALRRTVGRHRTLLAAVAAAVSVLATLAALAPPADPRVLVVVAARGLPAGTVLSGRDVTTAALPPEDVPDRALRPGTTVTGRALAGAVRRGEPLTDVRLAGAGLLGGAGSADGGLAAGTVAAPVRIADPGVAALVRPGDRIDVLATPADGAGPTEVAAGDVLVLAVPRAAAADGDGALLLLATTPVQATTLARAAVGEQLSVTLRGG